MKLKKHEDVQLEPIGDAAGGAVIADRFKLENLAPVDANRTGKGAAMAAMICSLVATAMLGAIAALMYVNWDLIQNT